MEAILASLEFTVAFKAQPLGLPAFPSKRLFRACKQSGPVLVHGNIGRAARCTECLVRMELAFERWAILFGADTVAVCSAGDSLLSREMTTTAKLPLSFQTGVHSANNSQKVTRESWRPLPH